MFQPHLIHAIINEPWAIHPDALDSFYPLIQSILSSGLEFEKGTPSLPVLHAASSPAAGPARSGSVVGDPGVKQIAVINISGPLMKNDQYCGPAGMKSMGAWIQQADQDPKVDGIILVIDSPGGTVVGTEELANIIKGTSKPTIAFVEDMACSAAYWLASSCDEIIANNSTAQVGSIGVLLSFMDIQPALELQGVKFHTVTAPQSTNKTKRFDRLRAGDYDEYKDTVLKPLADKFINAVKANRGNLDDKYFTADVYFAQDVIGSLVDSIGTFNQALQRCADLAQASANSNPPDTSMSKTDYKRLAKASSVDNFESADGTISLTADQAQAVETALEQHETAQASLQQQIDQSANQQTRITDLEAELQTATDRIAELENGAGSDTATVNKDTDASETSTQDEGFWARFARLNPLNNK